MRAVRLAPPTLQQLFAVDLDVIAQRLDDRPFDLIIATNVFIYYNDFDQALALANIEKMLRPGGFLLVNSALPNIAALSLRPVASLTTLYTEDRIGDEILWFQRPSGATR